MRQQHLFILGDDAIKAVSEEEAQATVEGLKTLGLYHLPYDRVTVRLPIHYAVLEQEAAKKTWINSPERRSCLKLGTDGKYHLDFPSNWYIEFTNLNLLGEPAAAHIVADDPRRPGRWIIDDRDVTHNCEGTINLLITLLATRNAVKETTHNKLARLGIGGRHSVDTTKRFEYVTRISLPKELEGDHETAREGHPKAPHLRRGHIRYQHYGPRGAYRKPIWIDPVFVNADHEFVSTRKAYNLCR